MYCVAVQHAARLPIQEQLNCVGDVAINGCSQTDAC